MLGRPKEFGSLLTQAITAIKARTGKSIEDIQDELGWLMDRASGNSYFYYLRKGNLPKDEDLSKLERLTRELVRQGGLSRDWTEKFLGAVGFPELIEQCDDLFDSTSRKFIPASGGNKAYQSEGKLVGRDSFVEFILSALQEPESKWLVGVDGMGGIGKSALAIEVGKYCQDQRLFDSVVEVRVDDRTGTSLSTSRSATFNHILNEIAKQLGATNALLELDQSKKEAKIRSLLKEQRVLVILDNLETADQEQDEIIEKLLPFLSPSKVLLTSRKRFKGDVYPIRLVGLSEKATRQFLTREAVERTVEGIGSVTTQELKKIVSATGGSPLALKLIVGQLAHLPIDRILTHLRNVQPVRGDTEKDDYIKFYRHIFFPSWELISANSRKLLLILSTFPSGSGGSYERVQELANRNMEGLTNNAFTGSIDELWRFAFLEIGRPLSIWDKRYFLHALTRHFVKSKFAKHSSEMSS